MHRISAYLWLLVLPWLLFTLTGCNIWAGISQRQIREKRQEIIAGRVLLRLQLDGREQHIVLPNKIDDDYIVGQTIDYGYVGPTLFRFPIARIKKAKSRPDLVGLRSAGIIVGTTVGVLVGLTLVGGCVYFGQLGGNHN